MDEKKQIEEMKKDIHTVLLHNCSYDFCEGVLIGFNEAGITRELYDEGYRKQSEWISVEERLPKDLETILALCKDGGMFVGRYIRYTSCDKWEIWTAMKSTRTVSRKVTHWMPLPEAPMKGGAEE